MTTQDTKAAEGGITVTIKYANTPAECEALAAEFMEAIGWPIERLERCDFDPNTGEGAVGDDGCQNKVQWTVGSRGEWHLCDSCAELPAFKRYRKRTPWSLDTQP